jgi:hypothetical protein
MSFLDTFPDDIRDELESVLENYLLEVTFHPQIWLDYRVVTSDDLETYYVPLDEAVDEGGIPADDTDASDRLREHEKAPERAQNWQGPFYVTTGEILKHDNISTDDE